jgi:hypothetical protein
LDLVPSVHADPGPQTPLTIGALRVGLLAPTTIKASGIAVAKVTVWSEAPDEYRAVRFATDLELDQIGRRYWASTMTLTAVTSDEMAKNTPELVSAGVIDTFDVEPSLLKAEPTWNAVRRAVMDDLWNTGKLSVLVGGDKSTMYDESLTADEVVALCWLLSRLTFDRDGVLVAQYLGCSTGAAQQRIRRARRAGIIPPADRPGQRKVRP